MTEPPAPGADTQDRPGPDDQEQEPSATLALVAAKLSDVGRMRPHNEDYVDYHIPPDPHQLAQKGSIFLVADGMGGHRAGEVASQGAVEKVISQYYSDASHDVPSSLVGAFRTANQQLHAQAQGDPGKAGMGTTLVAAVILGQKVYVANVGDSRAYLIRDKGITQITEDHSWVGEQVRAGLLTEDQSRRHPQRNLVTRALASKPSVDVDLFEGEISPGDSILLCTDGLTGRVQDAEIAAAVLQHTPEEATRRLVAQANERGGNDNITVLIVTADEAIRATRAAALAPSGQPQRGLLILGLIGLILAGLAVGAYLGTQWWLAPGNAPAALGTETSPANAASPFASETIPAQTAAATDGTPPGETPLPPTGTLAAPGPTATFEAAISPPTLVQPQEGDLLRGMVTFTWDYSLDELDPGHAFQV
ncbi:MAG: Stp1/IreP family PP2C-type Ser/Thr phosphatase, partial [Anaerolineae bacterium]|nr:Stp1/IreP family PP2C-type Ser/Thr phosphatase [Anaerolineae bacterium]